MPIFVPPTWVAAVSTTHTQLHQCSLPPFPKPKLLLWIMQKMTGNQTDLTAKKTISVLIFNGILSLVWFWQLSFCTERVNNKHRLLDLPLQSPASSKKQSRTKKKTNYLARKWQQIFSGVWHSHLPSFVTSWGCGSCTSASPEPPQGWPSHVWLAKINIALHEILSFANDCFTEKGHLRVRSSQEN